MSATIEDLEDAGIEDLEDAGVVILTHPHSALPISLCKRQMDLGDWQWIIVN